MRVYKAIQFFPKISLPCRQVPQDVLQHGGSSVTASQDHATNGPFLAVAQGIVESRLFMFHRQVSDPPLGQDDVRLAKGIRFVIRIRVDACFWTGKEKKKTKVVHHSRSVVDLYDVWS